jgi:hypothetical protein
MVYMVTKLGLCRARPGGVDHRKGNRRRLRKRFRPQVITPIPDRFFLFRFRCIFVTSFIGNGLFVVVKYFCIMLYSNIYSCLILKQK